MNGRRNEDDPDCCCDETEGSYHSCPFDVEINDRDDDDACDCCASCELECGLSV